MSSYGDILSKLRERIEEMERTIYNMCPVEQKLKICKDEAVALYYKLVLNPIEGVTPEKPESHCFRLQFPPGCVVSGLSVSVPLEAPEMIETALYDSATSKIICNSNIGYEDVRRFENIDQLRDEIQRLLAIDPASIPQQPARVEDDEDEDRDEDND